MNHAKERIKAAFYAIDSWNFTADKPRRNKDICRCDPDVNMCCRSCILFDGLYAGYQALRKLTKQEQIDVDMDDIDVFPGDDEFYK